MTISSDLAVSYHSLFWITRGIVDNLQLFLHLLSMDSFWTRSGFNQATLVIWTNEHFIHVLFHFPHSNFVSICADFECNIKYLKKGSKHTKTLLKNGYVVSMDTQIGNIKGYDVLVEDDLVVAVGKNLPWEDSRIIDESNWILLPGFVRYQRITTYNPCLGGQQETIITTYGDSKTAGAGWIPDPAVFSMFDSLSGEFGEKDIFFLRLPCASSKSAVLTECSHRAKRFGHTPWRLS